MNNSKSKETKGNSKRTIIYEDDEIRVIARNGSSAYNLITFGDMCTLVDGLSFFADSVVEKADIHAVGIIPKRYNWYPKKSLLAASAAILKVIRPHSDTILYGGSMGGYGAIKYSKLLSATHVLALCPQWSIDSTECEGFNPGWQAHFNPSMRNMGIKSYETEGQITLITDTFDRTDRWHLVRILEVCPSAHVVTAPWIGHHVTSVLAGSENLILLLEKCRKQDMSAMRKIVREARKEHLFRRIVLINATQKRHRSWAIEIYVATARIHPIIISKYKSLFLPAVRLLAKTGRLDEAVDFYRRYRSSHNPMEATLIDAAAFAEAVSSSIAVRTCHKTSLYYDAANNVVRHSAWAEADNPIPLLFEVNGQKIALAIQLSNSRLYLNVDQSGHLVVPSSVLEDNPFIFRLQYEPNGTFSIVLGDFYVSAEPSGRIVCNRRAAKDWEIFAFDVLSPTSPS
jgi:hypothetical protein